MTDKLPIVDLSQAEEAVAFELGRAARGIGFFYLTGHGVPDELLVAVFRNAEQFFRLPPPEKEENSITRSPHNRGYVRMKGESLDPSRPPDLKEAFNIGLDLVADDPRVVRGEPFRGVNLWPKLSGWRATMLAYFDAVWAAGRKLHRAIALDLGLPAAYFADKLDQPMATLRLLHYPPQAETADKGQIGAGEHTDYGNITLLLTDSVGGLEVKRRDGGWIAAPTLPGAFICNIGDCLMRWTNDVYVSTPHRVVNKGDRDRYSIAFFLDPNPDTIIACLPPCVSADRPARYAPISGADYLKSRLDSTYAFRQKAAGP